MLIMGQLWPLCQGHALRVADPLKAAQESVTEGRASIISVTENNNCANPLIL